jgi:predicted Rossmann fold flavoprotein
MSSMPSTTRSEIVDVLIIGAGAAGLMAGIWAGRTHSGIRILALDGARRLGAKIVVSGGGRCNVTHTRVDESDFAGSSPHAIRKVLRRFDVASTVSFFRELGVDLKTEEDGRLFPKTDSSKTVLAALLDAASQAGVILEHPRKVMRVEKVPEGFLAGGEWGEVLARSVVLAAGGKSLPKSGSDGAGYLLAKSLGHSTTDRISPALVPLLLPADHFIRELAGLTVKTSIELVSRNGRRLKRFTDSTLCTHLGLSGPAVLNISRYYLQAKEDDPGSRLLINWLPDRSAAELDQELRQWGTGKVASYFRRLLPDRLVGALFRHAGVSPETVGHRLTRADRLRLVANATGMELPITGDRGFTVAEVTAGGIPLSEIHLDRMESRRCPRLFVCGEICDVDGRIGGFNFQWAWASGYVAGTSVTKFLDALSG